MKKKGLLITLLLVSTISIVSVPSYILTCGFGLPEQYGDTFLGQLKHKVARLDSIQGKKIVFIGGSSLPFGIRCDMIEKNIKEDYEIMDFGMYAGLGTKIMLDFALPSIRKDDIVIICPEQNPETLSLHINTKYLWQALDGNFKYLSRVKSEDKGQLIGDFTTFAMEKAHYYYTNTRPKPNDVYQNGSFNEYGDINSEFPDFNHMIDGVDYNQLAVFDERTISSDFIDYMNDFNKTLKSKGATTFYRFAPTNELCVRGNIDEYYTFLSNQLDFEIMGDPNDSILDFRWFYDTNFHLNNNGAVANTINIIKDLKVLFGDTTPIQIDMPEKPFIPEKEDKDGDNTFVDKFNYEINEKTAKITGLLDDSLRNITIPYKVENKRIVTFAETTFQNNKNISEIMIQDNIAQLYDYSFQGCSNLKKIIITNTNPSSIRVNENLLDGTEAKIYVPKEAIGNYKQNYSWSNYSDRIYPLEDR